MSTPGHRLSQRYPTALITGASSGIGKSVAMALLECGVKVTGTTRSPDNPNLPGDVQWLLLDGSTEEGLELFINSNRELLMSINLLINNSGSSCFGKASEIPDEVKKSQHQLLFQSPVRLTEMAMGPMLERGTGAIVNVSSLAALFTIPYMEAYSFSKAALSEYTQQVIQKNRGTGVTIIDFQPGDYRTEFNRNISRYGEQTAASDRVWNQLEKNLNSAPPPEIAAQDILRALEKGQSRTVRSGSFFQSRVAPLGHRLFPDRWIHWGIRKYYRIS